jgi:hypothetical protein
LALTTAARRHVEFGEPRGGQFGPCEVRDVSADARRRSTFTFQNARLIYTRNNGNGGEYEYYTCLFRRTGRWPCTRKPMRLEKIEDGITRFYAAFRLRQSAPS